MESIQEVLPTRMINEDLISRTDAISQLTKRFDDIQMLDWKKYPNAPFIQSGLLWSINTIRDLPSAQQKANMKSVVRGHWINVNEGKWNTIEVLKCSVCGEIDSRVCRSDNFCPNCGAYMR